MARPQMIHGLARIKKEIPSFYHSIGDGGMITAFLPKEKIFSIYFNGGHWVTFESWTLEKFKEHFEYELFDEERRFTQ